MLQRRKQTLTPEEARKLHYEALVIDAQQPPATSGCLFTERMRAALNEYIKRDGTKVRDEISPLIEEMAVREIKTSPEAQRPVPRSVAPFRRDRRQRHLRAPSLLAGRS